MTKITEYLEALKGRITLFRRVEPIGTYVAYKTFLATRASFIAQKTLYGYVKTRMGMKYPRMFEDDVFIESLNIAKWQIYAACLSDLAVFMSAQVYRHTGDDRQAGEIAERCHDAIIRERFSDPGFTGDSAELVEAFANRLALQDWNHAVDGEGAFRDSPKALVRWSPIADELKKLDAEIVRNSIRFQWQRVRSDFRSAFDADAFLTDWHQSAGSTLTG